MKRDRTSRDPLTCFKDELQLAHSENRDFTFTKSEILNLVEIHSFGAVCLAFLKALRETSTTCVVPYNPNTKIESLVKQVRDACGGLLQSYVWTYRNTTTIFSEKTRLLVCSTSGQRLSSYFSGDIRYCQQVSKSNSAQQSWDDDVIMLKILNEVLKFPASKNTLTQNRLRANILMRGNCQYPTSFPIPVVLYILRREAARRPEKKLNTFLDPCAGWGDRLAGALIAGPEVVERYIGIDPWSVAHRVCNRVREKLETKDQVVELWQQTAQDPKPWPDVDLVFTSPPYAKLECYGQSTEESASQAWTLCAENKFMTDFLVPMMQKAAKATLARKGRVIINICNTTDSKKGARLTEEIVTAAKLAGLSLVEIMGMSTGNRKKCRDGVIQAEPIFIFQH